MRFSALRLLARLTCSVNLGIDFRYKLRQIWVIAARCDFLQYGAKLAREEMIHRSLGMKQLNNRWEVREGTEMMGVRWVAPYWVDDDGKQVRRITWLKDEWRFEAGLTSRDDAKRVR
jgi:hypothetical protein